MLRSNSKSLSIPCSLVRPEEEKERLWWEGFAEKEGFKPVTTRCYRPWRILCGQCQ